MSELSELTFSIPARVLTTTAQRKVDLLTLAKEKHAFDPAFLEERAPFFWGAEISSDLVDSHYSHMLPSTLMNFQEDAVAGVAFLPGHKHNELPFGRSVDAQIESADNPQRTRVVADFYTVPGLTLNAVRTDDLIDGIRSGILRDVSVGFHGGEYTCDVCQRDVFSWDCPHVPGVKYEIKEDGVVRVKLATFAIDGARLSEVSSVFDGSTPRAEILKAEREAAEGRMKPDAVRLIEERYRVKLPVAKRGFAGADVPGKDNGLMEFEQIVNQMREVLAVPEGGDVVATVTGITGELAQLRTAKQDADKRISELEPQAADGKQYRSDLVTEAIAEGVRAHGEKFDTETYTAMLKGAPLTTIKRMKADWEAIGNERFPAGRTSKDGDGQAPGKQSKTQRVGVPTTAYKV